MGRFAQEDEGGAAVNEKQDSSEARPKPRCALTDGHSCPYETVDHPQRVNEALPVSGASVLVRGTFVSTAKLDQDRVCVRFAPNEEEQWMPRSALVSNDTLGAQTKTTDVPVVVKQGSQEAVPEGLPSAVRFVLQKYEVSNVGHHDHFLADALEALRAVAIRTGVIHGMTHERERLRTSDPLPPKECGACGDSDRDDPSLCVRADGTARCDDCWANDQHVETPLREEDKR